MDTQDQRKLPFSLGTAGSLKSQQHLLRTLDFGNWHRGWGSSTAAVYVAPGTSWVLINAQLHWSSQGIATNNQSLKLNKFNVINVMTIKRQINHGILISLLPRDLYFPPYFESLLFGFCFRSERETTLHCITEADLHSSNDSVNIILEADKNEMGSICHDFGEEFRK